MLTSVLAGLLPVGAAAQDVATGRAPGLDFNSAYKGEPIRNLRGGQRTGGTYLDNLDLQLQADPGSIFSIPGLSGLLYVLYNNSSEFSAEYVGDAQVVSNIDAPRGLRIFEAWLDWAPGAGPLSTRVGLYNLNSEFDSIETGGLFLNSAQGIGPDFSQSGRNGPSIFPVTSLALRLRAALGNGGYGQVAVLDGVPGDPEDPGSNKIYLSHEDGALLVAEFGWAGDEWRMAVGTWRYTANFDRLDPANGDGSPITGDGNAGWYAIADRTVWRREATSVAAFLRAGHADDRYNQFDFYVGTGATMSGFLATRPDDELGLAIAVAMTGDGFEASRAAESLPTDHHETAIELTWRAPITDWLTLQPDVQYIINPGTDPGLDNALTISLRFELTWSKSLTGG